MCNDWMLLCILGIFVGGWVVVGGLVAGVVALIGGALSNNKLIKYASIFVLVPVGLFGVALLLLRFAGRM